MRRMPTPITYDPVAGDQNIDLIETQRKLELIRRTEVKTPGRKEDPRQAIRELLDSDLPNVERELKEMQNKLEAMTDAQLNNYADRKSTRLNSSHLGISYAVFCLKKK